MTSTPKRRLIGLSTKMYFPLQRTLDFIASARSQLVSLPPDALDNVDIFFIPDFISIHPVGELLKSSTVSIRLGAQDCHWDDSGPFTGEVSPAVLKEAGVTIVEVGHAERRKLFGETDLVVSRKAAAVSRNGMAPLICIGEKTRGDLETALSECVVQVDQAVADISDADAEVIIAYEPVWAIGADQPASDDHVVQVVKGIRSFGSLKRRTNVRLIYGGSAGPGLFERLGEAVDGLFLGRFGHDISRFMKTVNEVAAFRS